MTWLQKLQAWIQSWQGIAAIIGSAVALLATIIGWWKSIRSFVLSFLRIVKFHWNFEEHFNGQFTHVDSRMDKLEDRIEDVEDGVVNGVTVRRDVMEEDRIFAWFESCPNGEFEWVNRLWREYTGMEIGECIGFGWINGIAESERTRILKEWRFSVSKGIRFDHQATLVNARNGQVTKVRLLANPGRRGKQSSGRVVLYSGRAIKIL